jgi:ATP synthase I subunit
LASDNSPSNGNDESPGFAAPEAVERRVFRNIFAVIAIAVVIAALTADLRFMLGLVLGGALALLNYKWLHSSLRAVLATGNEKTPPGTMIKFVVRWLVIAAVAWAANKTGYFDPVAILAGLFAPAVAVMIEAAYVAYKSLTTRENDN